MFGAVSRFLHSSRAERLAGLTLYLKGSGFEGKPSAIGGLSICLAVIGLAQLLRFWGIDKQKLRSRTKPYYCRTVPPCASPKSLGVRLHPSYTSRLGPRD